MAEGPGFSRLAEFQRGADIQMTWDDKMIARCVELWRMGWSASEISRSLGGVVSRNAVLGKVHRLGVADRGMPAPLKRLPVGGVNRPRKVKGPAKPKAPRKPKVIKAPEPEYIPGDGITLDELPARGRCRWPHGDPAKDDFRFCGHKTGRDDEGASRVYCDHHFKIAHVPSRPKRKRSGNLEGFLDFLSSRRRVDA
jgi:GcrA cell cycle regulator